MRKAHSVTSMKSSLALPSGNLTPGLNVREAVQCDGYHTPRFTAPMFGYSCWQEYYGAARLADKLASIKVLARVLEISSRRRDV